MPVADEWNTEDRLRAVETLLYALLAGTYTLDSQTAKRFRELLLPAHRYYLNDDDDLFIKNLTEAIARRAPPPLSESTQNVGFAYLQDLERRLTRLEEKTSTFFEQEMRREIGEILE